MATLVLSAAGAAVGSSVGGSVLGLSAALVGRAVGATLGQAIDQRIFGAGSDVVETGRVDRFRLTGASEGASVDRVHGRLRVAGQVIWASDFLESRRTQRVGGKGGAGSQSVRSYSYSVSLAIALCEGEIADVARVWADGTEIGRDTITMRVYPGSGAQLPDAKIAAVEGLDNAPAYRGTAYVVIEDLDLSAFGNRVPQFSFEVLRPDLGAEIDGVPTVTRGVKGVALIPGTGEYSLATTQVRYETGPGRSVSANVHVPGAATDLAASLDALQAELPECGSVALVVSWFGDDLRCGECRVRPKVEQTEIDGTPMPWRVAGEDRWSAGTVPKADGRPVYGGTPADAAVIEGIREISARGMGVMFYPFILMEQMPGNGRTDPWSGAPDQPVLPWRGRITTSSRRNVREARTGPRPPRPRWPPSSGTRRRPTSRWATGRSATAGRKRLRCGGSSCIMRPCARRRAVWRPSASVRRCAGSPRSGAPATAFPPWRRWCGWRATCAAFWGRT